MKKRLKKKKGFTLVELIAVIAILAVIITIAGISITAVKKNILEKQKINLQSTIKTAAQSYHDETGVSIVPVNVLLQIGALQADTTEYVSEDGKYEIGDPVIMDPVDGDPINCDAVVFKDGTVEYVEEKGCDADAIAENALIVLYKTPSMSEAKPYTNGDWIILNDPSEKLTLTVNNVGDSLEYRWTNLLAPDTSYTGSIYEVTVPDSALIDDKFRIETTIDGVVVSSDFDLKVDAKTPTVENYYVTDEFEWKQEKYIVGNLIDNESKLLGYQILNDANPDCSKVTDWITTDITGKNTYTVNHKITENGYYTICVKDIAGHVTSSATKITVTKVDNKKPKLYVSVPDGTEWAKTRGGTITLKDLGNDNDNIAGFNNKTITVKYGWSTDTSIDCNDTSVFIYTANITLNTTLNEYDVAGTIPSVEDRTGKGYLFVCPVRDNEIVDKAGNVIEYTPSIVDTDGNESNMYLDNTAPVCGTQSSSDNSTAWTNQNRTITIPCTDAKLGKNVSQSGCAAKNYSTKYGKNEAKSNLATDSVVIYDNVGNSTTCPYTVNVDTTAPVCGSLISSDSSFNWTNKTRTITQECSDQDGLSGCDGPFSITYSSTQTKEEYQTIKDKAGNTTTCSSYLTYVDTDKPTCGDSDGESTTWTNSNRTINQYCNDTGDYQSGCTNFPNTYTTTTTTGSTTIKDNAGNTKTCSYDVYVDKTNPTSSISAETKKGTSYNTIDEVTITVSGSDKHSGVTEYCYNTTNSSYNCNWQTSGTFTGVNTNKSYESGGSVTYYGFTKDNAGNISPSSTTTYTVYKHCDKSYHKNSSSFGECDAECDGGNRYADDYYYDKYFTSVYCYTKTNGSSESCNTRSCCTTSTIKYKDGNTCTVVCGGGTYNRLAYSIYDDGYGIRCSSYDKSSGGASCNTSQCCQNPGDWSSCSSSCGAGTRYKYGTNASTGATCTYASESCTGTNCPPANCYLKANYSGNNTFTPYWSPSACAGTVKGCSTSGGRCWVSGTASNGQQAGNYMCTSGSNHYWACDWGKTVSGCSGNWCSF